MKKGSPINLKKGLKGPGRGGKLSYGENRVNLMFIYCFDMCVYFMKLLCVQVFMVMCKNILVFFFNCAVQEFPEGDAEDTEPMEEGEPHSTSTTSNDSSSAPDSPATPGNQMDNSMESDNPITHPGKWTVRPHFI